MDSIANGYGCRPCKIKQVQLDVTDAIIHFIGDGSSLSHLNASNVDFGTLSTTVFPASGVTAGTYGSSSNISQITIDQYGRVTSAANVTSVSSQWTGLPGSSIYYIPGVSIGSSNDATANLQVTGNVYVSNSVTTTNVYATNYYGDGGLLSNVASQWSGTKGSPIYYIPGVSVGSSSDATANLQVTGNVYVSNAVTVPNIYVTDTFDVLGSMTANAANATFFFDTFTIPYINTQYLNVSSDTTLTGNLIASTANIATLNVGYLTVNSAVVYGATTLNVYGVSNLTDVFATTANVGTLNVWQVSNLSTLTLTNTLTTNNVYAMNDVVVGPSPFALQANLHVERGDVFIGNSAIIGSSFATTGSVYRLKFDNSSNTSLAANEPNKIIMFSNAAGGLYCGIGVTGANGSGCSVGYYAATHHIFYNGAGFTAGGFTNSSTLSVGGINAGAKLYVFGSAPSSNLHVRIDSSNIALVTSGGNKVGINTLAPSANLHVVGNVYASNAVTTTNVFANTSTLTGTTGQTTLNVTGNLYVSNALTTTNVFATTVNTTNPIPFRNRIINGGMTLWQRNVASISTTASFYSTADRWCGALGTSGLILSQWPGPTENLQFPYSLQVTTSTATTGTPLVEQRIEYLNIPDFLNGTPVTVSFWAGQPYGTLMPLTVGLYYATAVNNFGTQTLAVAATKNTPTLTAANAYYSLSFTLTTGLAATNGLSLRFTTGAASAVGSTVLLTGVQVEKGAAATPFEIRPYATELALAQRYYYQLTSPTAAVIGAAQVYSIFGTATGITTTAFWLPIQFPVPMRTPNYTFSNSAVTNFQLLPTGTTTITSVGVQTDSYTPVSATLNFVGTNITAGGSYIFRTNGLTGTTTAFFGFSCEL